MTKIVKVTIDIEIARSMLSCIGIHLEDNVTDEEVLDKTLELLDCYGVTFEVQEGNSNG